jgi:hypothetical protein
MFDPTCDLTARPETLDGQSSAVLEKSPETAGSYTCPHCSWVNWCTFDAGHSGDCHCDQGHYWSGNH